uniref:uncharacterized protein LOC105351332 n=1 Tax=Fragaria vesca subsp. vesca TaxID=101020 RepID=UPI0005CA8123|nr:PREDICTED: uncharacterized protein LOC105351332 [Fragaria vesca subsp. vesca]
MEKYMLEPLMKSSSGGSSLLMRTKNIDDLPDVLLVEILCRLPCNKLIFQCKLVSKPWYKLISAPYFVRRYLCLQRQMQKPVLLTTLVRLNVGIPGKPLIITSDHPVFKTAASSNFTLNFLPCYSQAKQLEEPGSWGAPVVVGTHNDLVLCCATKNYQRDYYLCNPYTKQWVSLPPTPQVYRNALVGFLCDPYFKYYSSDHHNGEEERRTSFIVDAEYKWKVVRVILNPSDPNFRLEIFSSETRQWGEIFVECSQPFSSFACDDFFDNTRKPRSSLASVAYKGMLYWWCEKDLTLELDVSDSNIPKYRFIELLENFESTVGLGVLGVGGGRLQLCMHEEYLSRDHDEVQQVFRVRELKQVVKDRQGKLKWLADRVTIVSESKDIEVYPRPFTNPKILAFHPNNEDVVYLTTEAGCKIFTCSLREGTLREISKLEVSKLEAPIRGSKKTFSYSFSLPWWPTPVPKTLE